ncbi:hypothetical protein [Phenylobacterium sp.]|uniref:hypothetical protein n=1 Tax=Phenylobacterium sp. TaxID=1871053 RepID=UPI00286BB10E|nr:hypothetical protein [Phenylobacterium sp.]
MPPLVLRIVAGLIGLVALGAFTLGIVNAPQRGRLPGEKPAASGAAVAPIQATEATPLGQDRIEGKPPPVPLTEEEQAKLEAAKQAKADADAAKVAAAGAAPAAVTPTVAPAAAPAPPPSAPPGEPPPQEEAPH